ncbi:uncharacterized protein V1510DRAFT_408248 [Dipodascopsis tothii]|uniref:uncharacterized protein n=1 Tax=Dipodascopsis tothii TaxID=44089 RepID=UPI0034CE0803
MSPTILGQQRPPASILNHSSTACNDTTSGARAEDILGEFQLLFAVHAQAVSLNENTRGTSKAAPQKQIGVNKLAAECFRGDHRQSRLADSLHAREHDCRLVRHGERVSLRSKVRGHHVTPNLPRAMWLCCGSAVHYGAAAAFGGRPGSARPQMERRVTIPPWTKYLFPVETKHRAPHGQYVAPPSRWEYTEYIVFTVLVHRVDI